MKRQERHPSGRAAGFGAQADFDSWCDVFGRRPPKALRRGLGERLAGAEREDVAGDVGGKSAGADGHTAPVSAKEIQTGAPGAWQAFLRYATQVFPAILESLGSCSRLLRADQPTGLLRTVIGCTEQATATALRNLSRVCVGRRMPGAGASAPAVRELCEVLALAAFRSLEANSLRSHLASELRAVDMARSSRSECAIESMRRLREELLRRRATRRWAARQVASESLPLLEASSQRLKELRQRRVASLRMVRFRSCRVIGVDGPQEVVLAFRGGHRLRLRSLSSSSGVPLRIASFEPRLQEFSSLPAAMRLKAEQLLCTAWLHSSPSAAGSQLGPLHHEEVWLLIRRLDNALLDVGEVIRDILRARRFACTVLIQDHPVASSACALQRGRA